MASPRPTDDKAAQTSGATQLPALDEDVRRALLALCEIASSSAKAPVAAIFLNDGLEQHVVAAAGVNGLPDDDTFFRHTLDEVGPLIVSDAGRDGRFHESIWVAGPAHIRFYAGFALEPVSGLRGGTLCVMDVQARELPDETVASLQQLSQAASAILALHRRTGPGPIHAGRATARTNTALRDRQSRMIPGAHVLRRTSTPRAQILRAIGEGEFVPFYQPKVELKWGRTIGLEVLARWRHPTRGLLAPGSFQSAISNPTITPLLTRSMLSAAMKDSAQWRASGLSPGRLAINVTTADLRNAEFADELLATLKLYNFNPRDLVIEVTEGIAMGQPEGQIHKTLAMLRSRGIRVMLDDFGTGFASLQHLRNWPIDGLKLDRGFVQNCLTDKEDQIIIRGIVQMCRELRLEIVAEGIETNAQYLFLANIGCDFGQGFYFSEPVPAADVPMVLKSTSAASKDKMPRAVNIP